MKPVYYTMKWFWFKWNCKPCKTGHVFPYLLGMQKPYKSEWWITTNCAPHFIHFLDSL